MLATPTLIRAAAITIAGYKSIVGLISSLIIKNNWVKVVFTKYEWSNVLSYEYEL